MEAHVSADKFGSKAFISYLRKSLETDNLFKSVVGDVMGHNAVSLQITLSSEPASQSPLSAAT